MASPPLPFDGVSEQACRSSATVIMFAVVLASQSALAAESTAATTRPAPRARTDRYQLAFGARASIGGAGFDTEGGQLLEAFARYQWTHGLGLQASFFHLDVANNESYDNFKVDALTLGPSWHPIWDYWFDPFAEAHLVGFVNTSGRSRWGYDEANRPSRLGVEGVLGAQVASRWIAAGLHARMGTTDHAWLLFGAQLEARF